MTNNSVNHSPAKKILAADDDPAILEILALILEDAGYEVQTTVNGQTEQMVHDFLPNLILLDIWMSGLDGRSVCQSLKSQKLTQNIPIIMISANNDTQKMAKEAGADDFMAKPFEIDDLLAMVEKYLH